MDGVLVERTVIEALIVERDEALGLAKVLGERTGTSVEDAVVSALRASLRETLPAEGLSPQPPRVPTLKDLTPERRRRYESLRGFVREIADHKVPGATSDHSDLYDDHGLPI
ncbi:hypothetical protein FV222_10085 [Methylobacterium sp. WL103]|nr:hypothetical protein FV226_21320 [Methylobacterium sp. WL12]TXN01899.1 hypothetical protein FV222_10085 [Methylobacterium sp. WL103]